MTEVDGKTHDSPCHSSLASSTEQLGPEALSDQFNFETSWAELLGSTTEIDFALEHENDLAVSIFSLVSSSSICLHSYTYNRYSNFLRPREAFVFAITSS